MGNSAFFNINNNQSETLHLITSSSSANTFDPQISFSSSKRARWDFGDGVAEASNAPLYVYSDSGITKNVTLSVERLKNITGFSVPNDNINGELNFSELINCASYTMNGNTLLTGVTFPSTSINVNGITAFFCDLRNIDLTVIPNIGNTINFSGNYNLTALTIPSSSVRSFTNFSIGNCSIYGRLDFSGYTGGFGGTLDFTGAQNLTGLTFPSNSTNITFFYISGTSPGGSLIDPLDLSGLSGLGGTFTISQISSPYINFPNVSNLTTTFNVNGNQNVKDYDLTGINLGGSVGIQSHTSLTAVTFPSVSNSITGLSLGTNTSIKDFDLSPLSGINSNISCGSCSSLSGITFPTVYTSIPQLLFNSCNFSDYVNFTPLTSNTNNDVYIRLDSNAIPTTGVNHILYDFDNFGWTGGTLLINGGTNGAPDGSSGGFDGTGSTANLLTKGWTVSTN